MPVEATSRGDLVSRSRGARPRLRVNRASSIGEYRRIVILTDGASRTDHAKTAVNLLRYRSGDILAVLDREYEGHTCREVFGVGGDTPIIASLENVPVADSLFLGIAPTGGDLPESWHAIIATALRYQVDVVSGLHDFVSDVPEFQQLSRDNSSRIVDIRRNNIRTVARHATFRPENLRVHTVGQDCCVGKMVVAVEVERRLRQLGHDAKFVATGQTGIMIGGHGVPVDSITADFVNGAVEELVLAHEHHDTVVVEGQGSLVHPSCSGVTLSLLHGCAPQGLIMCYAPGRTATMDFPHVALQSLPTLIGLYEDIASVRCPCEVIAIAMNSRGLSPAEVVWERERVEAQTGLPVCDVYADGADVLAQAVLDLRVRRIS